MVDPDAPFSDTKTIDLADRLPVVLYELELRAAAAEERDRRLERERQERQSKWEAVRDDARVQVRDQHRATSLLKRVEAWRQAEELDAFLDAMATRAAELDGTDREAAQERGPVTTRHPVNDARRRPMWAITSWWST